MHERPKNKTIKVIFIIIVVLFLQGCIFNEKKPQKGVGISQNTTEIEPDIYKETGIDRDAPVVMGTAELLQVDADIQAIAQASLEWAILDKNIPDYNMIKDKKHLVLSTRSINKGYNFALGNSIVSILTPEEIKQKSDVEGDYLYLEFETIVINGREATVKLNNIWVQNETSSKTIAYLSGGGAAIPFKKEGDVWVRQNITQIWIS